MDFSVRKVKQFLVSREQREIHDTSLQRAAVLVGLFRKNETWHLLMTKRSDEVEHHKGQISFPGGAVDTSDRNIVATALRETAEEIGLQPEKVQILGCLDDHVTPTGFIITPVVGYIKDFPRLKRSTKEVVEILKVPISLFLDERNERKVRMERRGEVVDVYFYDFGGHEIWGATARITRDFLREFTRRPL